MKKIACLAVLLAALVACGRPVSDAPAGVCFRLASETDGRRDPDVVVWRPCEDFDQIRADGRDCKVHILDRVEYHFRAEPEVTTEEECYADR